LGVNRRHFLTNSLAVAAGTLGPGMEGAVKSPHGNSFRLYPYGSVQFQDTRIKAPLTFAHVTDLHLTPDPKEATNKPYRHGIEWWDATFNRPHQVLPTLLAEIRAAGVDFVFFGGDNIDCYDPQIAERLAGLVQDYGLKAYFQSGNHDWESLPIRYVTHQYDASLRSENLRKLCRHWGMPASYYSFELKGIRFVVLDPPYMKVGGSWSGFFDDEQTEWFLKQLQHDGPIVVFHHIPFHPPTLEYRLRTVWGGQLACVADDANGQRVLHAIETSPNILGTLTGHAHIRSEDPLGQTCQFMTAPLSDAQWRYVKISDAPPPKSLRAEGTPDIRAAT